MTTVKELIQSVRMARLTITLAVTCLAFLLELVVAQITHSLTLLVVAYHMLYNFVALAGCVTTVKLSQRPPSLRNTFGWTRLEILATLVSLVLLSSLCFSLCVESVQTMVHSGHQDEMHHPIPVGAVAIVGIMVNLICTALIGGYSFHQGCFLHQSNSGVTQPPERITEKSVRQGLRRVPTGGSKDQVSSNPNKDEYEIVPTVMSTRDADTESFVQESDQSQRLRTTMPNMREVFRDNVGCLFVIVDAAVVYCVGGDIALYADPIIAISSVLVLLLLSWPYFTEASSLLLQTIPGHLDITNVKSKLLVEFPCIVNVHELHIWGLGSGQTVGTLHVVFSNEQDYLLNQKLIPQFFTQCGISEVTVQPEFKDKVEENEGSTDEEECFLRCRSKSCRKRQCCGAEEEEDIESQDLSNSGCQNKNDAHGHSHGSDHAHGHSHNHSHGHGHGHSHGASTVKYQPVAESSGVTEPVLIDRPAC